MTFIKAVLHPDPKVSEAKINVLEKYPELGKICQNLYESFPDFEKLGQEMSKYKGGSEIWGKLSQEEKVELYSTVIVGRWSYGHHEDEDLPIKKWLAKYPNAFDGFDKADNIPVLYRSFCFWDTKLLNSFLSGKPIEKLYLVQSWAVDKKAAFDYMDGNNVSDEVIASCIFKKKIPTTERIASLYHEKSMEARGEGEVLSMSQILTLDDVDDWYMCDASRFYKVSVEKVITVLKQKVAAYF